MAPTPVAVAHEATTHDLWSRAAAVAGRLNRAHGDLVDVAAELVEGGHWGDGGFSSPEHWLVVRAGLSPAQAADVVRIARRRRELPDTIAALTAGELSIGQVAVVARHAPADHQGGIAVFARTTTVPQLRRALSKSVFLDPNTGLRAEPSSPGPDHENALLAQQAGRRAELSMHYDHSGRFHLRYCAPAEIGALVEQAVKEAKDALFTATDPSAAALPHPSYADAVAEIANRSLASITSTSRASHYRVYLHLDTDGSWVNGAGPITPRLAARFTCDGTITPLWQTEGRPVSVGRDQRILPARTRRLIQDRDRGCRVPGCTTTRFVEIHHLHHWAHGGATDYDTQVSLCPFHHDAHHRGDLTITGDPTRPDGLTVTNRHGLTLAPPTTADLAPPDPHTETHTPAYPSPSGGPLHARDVELVPDAWQTWRNPLRSPAIGGPSAPPRSLVHRT